MSVQQTIESKLLLVVLLFLGPRTFGASQAQVVLSTARETITNAVLFEVSQQSPLPQEQKYQYMAICTEKQEHGGDDYPLTSWVDTVEEANAAGKKHEQETHGHRWRIDTRIKPET